MVAFTLYQTSTKLYAIRHDSGGSDGEECWRVLKLDRSSATLEAAEDTHPYTRPQIQRLLASIHAGELAAARVLSAGAGASGLSCFGQPADGRWSPKRSPACSPLPTEHRTAPQATRVTVVCSWCARRMRCWAPSSS